MSRSVFGSPALLLLVVTLVSVGAVRAEMNTEQAGHTPGPYIIPIDYDKLYQMAQPLVYLSIS